MDAWLEPGVMPCDTTTTKIGHMDRQRSRAIGNDPPSVRAYATSRSDSSLGATCSRASPFAAQASRIMARLRFSACDASCMASPFCRVPHRLQDHLLVAAVQLERAR